MNVAALHRWALAALPEASAAADHDPIDAMASILFEAEEAAHRLLRSELDPAAAECFGTALPRIVIGDAAGRPIVAARLEREPGTDRFTLVLLTEEP